MTLQQKQFATAFIAVLLFSASVTQAQTPPVMEQQPLQPKPAWLAYKNPYSGEENDITQPRLSSEDVTTWSQEAIADILSFGSNDYRSKLGGFKKYFVAQGWQAYTDFLKNTQLIDKVKNDGSAITTIVTTHPDIISHGLTDNAYHWIVKMPVTISFFTSGNNKDRLDISNQYFVFIDVIRVAEGGDKGVAIQNWRVDDAPIPVAPIVP